VDTLVLGIVWYVVLLFSLTFHEASHAWVALRGGDRTAYRGGQVSLDPAPHIRREPFGTVVFPLLSFALGGWMFGWASTPYDPAWAHAHPRRAGWMSLAGPLANLALVLVAALAIRVGLTSGVFSPPASIDFSHLTDAVAGGLWSSAATLLSILFTLNLILFGFNLLPFPPLDGSGVLSLVLPEGTARRVQAFFAQPALSLGGILLAFILFREVFPPLHLAAINLLYPGLGYGYR
jgi:Zn-dependent protease